MATAAGQRISSPDELSSLGSGDIARVGTDIYRRDLAAEQTAMKTWEGGRGTDESDLAFNTSVYAPQPIATPEAEIINRTSLQDNINNSLLNPDVKSNQAFIQGVSKLATGQAASKENLAMEGSSLSDVVNAFGIGDKFTNFGMDMPKVEDTTKIEPAAVKEEQAPSNYATSELDRIIEERQAGTQEPADVEAARTKMTAAEDTRMELARDIDNKKIIDAEVMQQIQERGGLLRSTINLRKEEYSEAEYIDNLKMVQAYNDSVIMENMAKGQYNQAVAYNQEIADERKEIDDLRINRALAQDQITEQEATRLKEQNEFERDMALEGYLYISDPKQLEPGGSFAGLKEDDLYRDPVSGRMYKKPEAEVDTKTVTANGRTLLINTQTGETIRDLGSAYKATGGPSTTSTLNLATGDKKRLIGAGIMAGDIDAIWDKVQKEGIESVIVDWDDRQAQVLLDVVNGVTTSQRAAIIKKDEADAGKLEVEIEKMNKADEPSTDEQYRLWVTNAGFEPADFEHLWEDEVAKKNEPSNIEKALNWVESFKK